STSRNPLRVSPERRATRSRTSFAPPKALEVVDLGDERRGEDRGHLRPRHPLDSLRRAGKTCRMSLLRLRRTAEPLAKQKLGRGTLARTQESALLCERLAERTPAG